MNALYFIRFFWLLLISLYIYKKILNLKDISKMKMFSAILFCLVVSIPLSYAPPFYEIIFTVSVFIFVNAVAREPLKLMVTAVIVSIGISLGSEMVVLFITYYGVAYTIPEFFTVPHKYNEFPCSAWGQMGISIVSFLLVTLFFQLKRLQKGFAFLRTNKGNWMGMFLGILIGIWRSIPPVIYAFIHKYNLDPTDAAIFQFSIFFVIFICLIGIHLWWRSDTTALYQKRLAVRREEENAKEIQGLKLQIKNITASNDFLSEAVHRDNKLVPAMYNAVADFLNIEYNVDKRKKGMNILKELEEIMKERNEMVVTMQKEHKILPTTEIDRVDYILQYMRQKALNNKIQFDFLMPIKIKDIAEAVISKQMLETLLADFIENAIIAVTHSSYKKILVVMGIVDHCFEINIQDSGALFEIDTFVNLGLKKASTYTDHGGTGIGYITIFKILVECKASLIISEFEPRYYSFSKSIKVRFDGKGEFTINSFRAQKIKSSTERADLFICSNCMS